MEKNQGEQYSSIFIVIVVITQNIFLPVNTIIVDCRLLKIYKKIHRFLDVLNYFTTQEWDFSTVRLRGLINKLTPKDRENFLFDMFAVNWDTYFQTYIQGIRVYLLKDPLETLPRARSRWQRFD